MKFTAPIVISKNGKPVDSVDWKSSNKWTFINPDTQSVSFPPLYTIIEPSDVATRLRFCGIGPNCWIFDRSMFSHHAGCLYHPDLSKLLGVKL